MNRFIRIFTHPMEYWKVYNNGRIHNSNIPFENYSYNSLLFVCNNLHPVFTCKLIVTDTGYLPAYF